MNAVSDYWFRRFIAIATSLIICGSFAVGFGMEVAERHNSDAGIWVGILSFMVMLMPIGLLSAIILDIVDARIERRRKNREKN